jgi:hypothetical protein
MTLFVYDTFLRDLHDHGDGNFAQRVVRKVLNANGTFRTDTDDHRYEGIENAWIRYVSGGASAYRAIYIREGEDIYLYRCGEHSIEDSLGPPRGNRAVAETVVAELALTAAVAANPPAEVGNQFRQNGRGRLLRSFLLGRRLFPHKEVVLVSPFLTLALLMRTNRVGLALDQMLEDGTKITLITRPPAPSEFDKFRELEVRGWDLLFHETLHAKLYIFKVDGEALYVDAGASDAALIGSANLTECGFGLNETNFNEELCFELPPGSHGGAMDYVYHLVGQAQDLERTRRKVMRRN